MNIKDDRTPEQMETHTLRVGGTDPGMSNWGGAAGGNSYAFWACTPEQFDECERAVRNRGDIKKIRIVDNDYRPSRYCADCHTYVYSRPFYG